MKKFLALVMAMMMILAMGTVAFADKVSYTATTATEFKEIIKTYTSENNVVVNETLTFASTAAKTNPDGGDANLSVADLIVSSLNPGTLTVTIPSLSKVGTYEWTIKENAGSTAGVTYSTDEVHVIVYVGYDNDTNSLKILNTTSYIKKENGTKAKTFENTFKSGEFTVEKKVIGDMASKNDEFEITVTLTSDKKVGTDVSLAGTTVTPSQWTESNGKWTATSKLDYSQAGGAKTFSNIPVGVTVTVSETESDMNGYTLESIKMGTSTFTSLTVADDTDAQIVVTNKAGDVNIETGISMDNAPYMMIMALVVLAGAAMLLKKRAYND